MYDDQIVFDTVLGGSLDQLKALHRHGVLISRISIKYIISYGSVDMLEWLELIGYTFDDPSINIIVGSVWNLDVIRWLHSRGFQWTYIALLACEIQHNYDAMELIFDFMYA